VKIHLAYGRRGLDFEIPEQNLAKVLTMKGAPPLEDPGQRLRFLLENPMGSEPLRNLAANASSACLVICDITRPVPNTLLLPPVLETLENSGLKSGQITLLVATGLHRPATPEELKDMVGETILKSYRVISHKARVSSKQEFLGFTGNKTPVHIDSTYTRAELKLTIGFIEPHLMAGFSGGRKLVAPGCAGEPTIKALHSPYFIENPYCREGSTEDNPLHFELLEIAGMAGHDFIVDVALDETRSVTGIFAGNPLKAHEHGVEHVRASARATLDQPADIVITTGAGYPLDLTFYQAIKGMTAALPAVKKGGTLIVAAECAEGLGSSEFSRMALKFRTVDSFSEAIARSPVSIDQWQLEECAKAARHAEILLVSPNISKSYGDKLFVRTMESIDKAFIYALEKHGPSATAAVIPKGPYALVGIAEG